MNFFYACSRVPNPGPHVYSGFRMAYGLTLLQSNAKRFCRGRKDDKPLKHFSAWRG